MMAMPSSGRAEGLAASARNAYFQVETSKDRPGASPSSSCSSIS